MTERKRLAVDMDEVLADIYPKYLDLFEKNAGYRPKKEDYWGSKLYKFKGGEHLRDMLYDPGFFRDLPVMDHAQEVMERLNDHYEIFIISAAMEFRNSLIDKYDWMQEHFPFIHWKKIILCGDKSFMKADYLIDDHVNNLETFDGKGLLYTSTHNIYEERYTRLNNWKEVESFFTSELLKDGITY